MGDDILYEFIELSSFASSAKGLLDDEGLIFVQETLRANPRAGAVERGTGGVRKIRVPLDGQGKRGGARVVYYFIERKSRVYLLLVYAKNSTAALTKAQKIAIRKLTAKLECE